MIDPSEKDCVHFGEWFLLFLALASVYNPIVHNPSPQSYNNPNCSGHDRFESDGAVAVLLQSTFAHGAHNPTTILHIAEANPTILLHSHISEEEPAQSNYILVVVHRMVRS